MSAEPAPMTPERFLKVSALFHAARARPVDMRAEFLQVQCGSDPALREEVESLLRHDLGELPTGPGPFLMPGAQPWPANGQVGPYQLVGLVGIGGMGVVYKAHDPRLGRDVALKVLLPEVGDNPERLKRFGREARATALLSHPNVVPVFEFATHEGTTFIVSEFIQGRTLRALLRDERLDVNRAVDLGMQLTHGLAAAHAAGIIHRDLKPENVLVTDAGQAKIVDFGLAKTMMKSRAADVEDDTAPGTVLGTFGYMAPEQLQGFVIDERADIFSLGAVLYELLSGVAAFRGDGLKSATAIISGAPRPLLEVASHPIPAALVRIVDRCLETLPGSRFQSASQVAFALKSLSNSPPEPAAPPAQNPPPTPAVPGKPVRAPVTFRDLVWLAAAAALGALLMLLMWQPWRQPR